MKYQELEKAMLECEQTPGLSILAHGQSVVDYCIRIVCASNSEHATNNLGLKLPKWFFDYQENLLGNIFVDVLKMYAVFHDCGKPFCRTVDENGKVHFPNHAEKSFEIWNSLEFSADELQGSIFSFIGQCILHDMDIHKIKTPEEIQEFAKLECAPYLLIAGLAEIHANAGMFGGLESESFKIKYAQLERRGKKVCQLMYGS